ncbi:MAG TPA: hypothetical protein VFR34_00920 [Paracoccaceae bacterium]|nr:hypothetical protein [Paracoccaceae bacterium]
MSTETPRRCAQAARAALMVEGNRIQGPDRAIGAIRDASMEVAA